MSTHLVGRKSFNPLHTNISIHILPTLLYTFLLVLTMRICLAIKAPLVGNHFLYSHDLNEWFSCITLGRIRCWSLLESKSLISTQPWIKLNKSDKLTITPLNTPFPQKNWSAQEDYWLLFLLWLKISKFTVNHTCSSLVII